MPLCINIYGSSDLKKSIPDIDSRYAILCMRKNRRCPNRCQSYGCKARNTVVSPVLMYNRKRTYCIAVCEKHGFEKVVFVKPRHIVRLADIEDFRETFNFV